jgi:transmembrane sensor
LENYSNIDDLIGKYLAGEASPDEAIFLDEWRLADTKQNQYFLDFSTLFYANAHATVSDQQVESAWDGVRTKIQLSNYSKSGSNNRMYFALAAAIAMVIGISAIYIFFVKPQTRFEFVAMNTPISIKLEDKTEIEVYKNSTIHLEPAYNKASRRIKLKGSAYFSVEHDTAKPFVVSIGRLNVKDIGTKFKIVSSANGDTIAITVDEGEVFLYDSLGFEKSIRANEHFTYILSEHATFEAKGKLDNTILKSFDFRNVSLKELVAKISQEYGASISVDKPEILNCRITVQFKQESLENVLFIVAETLGLEIQQKENEFIIIGNQCKG